MTTRPAVLALLAAALAAPLRAQDEPAPAEPGADALQSVNGVGIGLGAADKAPSVAPAPAPAADDAVCPNTAPTAPVDATPGWLGDLAFDDKRGRWLVVSHQGAVRGRLMSDAGAPAGDVFEVSPPGQQCFAPMTAYASGADEFLVVWVDYSKGGSDLWGRFVSGAGEPKAPFPIPFAGAPGAPILNLGGERTSALRYDTGAGKFVLVTDARSDKDHVVLLTIDLAGKASKPVEVGSMANGGNWAPSVAVGPGEYCVAWDQRNSPRWAVARVSPSGLVAGKETSTAFTTTNVDISWNARSRKYLAIYDAGYGVGVRGRLLNSCDVNDAAADFLMLAREGYSSVAANGKSGVYAAIGQDAADDGNGYAVVGAQGERRAGGPLFARTSKNGNYLPVIKPNTTTGAFAAITSRDYAMTQFVSRIGCASAAPPLPQDSLVSWLTPENNGSGSGDVGLAGSAGPSVKKLEILVNLKKVGDATLSGGGWYYLLDTRPYRGGINLSALATDDKGATTRWTIRFNVTSGDAAPR